MPKLYQTACKPVEATIGYPLTKPLPWVRSWHLRDLTIFSQTGVPLLGLARFLLGCKFHANLLRMGRSCESVLFDTDSYMIIIPI